MLRKSSRSRIVSGRKIRKRLFWRVWKGNWRLRGRGYPVRTNTSQQSEFKQHNMGRRTSITIAFISNPSALPLLAPSTSYTANNNFVIIPLHVINVIGPNSSVNASVGSFLTVSASLRKARCQPTRQLRALSYIRTISEENSRIQQ